MKDHEIEEIILELAENHGVWISKRALYMVISMMEDGEIVFIDDAPKAHPS